MNEHPEENCPWSLSGPQFSLPAGIQQRYCYPKGNPEYSRKKGGALWTTYDENGKENLDYRLLHVYFSAKRALRDQTPTSDIKESHVTAKKHRAHHSIFRNDQFPPPICRTPPSFDLVNSHQSHVDEVLHSSSTCFYTPLSAENHDHNYPTWQNYDRLPNRDPNKTTDKSSHDTHFRYHCSNHVSPEVYSTGYPRHFPNESENHSHNPRNERTRLSTALDPPTCHLKNEFSSQSRRDSILSTSSCEPLPVDIDIDLFEQTDSLAFSNSKKLNKANNTEHQIQNEYHISGENKKQIDNFAAYLGDIHKNIQKRIMDSKESEQFRCVDALVYWAKKVAQSPLDISDKKEENAKINLTSLNSESLLINNIDCVRHFAEI